MQPASFPIALCYSQISLCAVSGPIATSLPTSNPDEINVDDAEPDPNEIALDDDDDYIHEHADDGSDSNGGSHVGLNTPTHVAPAIPTDDGLFLKSANKLLH